MYYLHHSCSKVILLFWSFWLCTKWSWFIPKFRQSQQNSLLILQKRHLSSRHIRIFWQVQWSLFAKVSTRQQASLLNQVVLPELNIFLSRYQQHTHQLSTFQRFPQKQKYQNQFQKVFRNHFSSAQLEENTTLSNNEQNLARSIFTVQSWRCCL